MPQASTYNAKLRFATYSTGLERLENAWQSDSTVSSVPYWRRLDLTLSEAWEFRSFAVDIERGSLAAATVPVSLINVHSCGVLSFGCQWCHEAACGVSLWANANTSPAHDPVASQ